MLCDSFKVLHTGRGHLKGLLCWKSKSLSRLRRKLATLQGFFQLQTTYRLARDLVVDIKGVTHVFRQMRDALFHLAELEGGKLKGEIELYEASFGGRGRG